MKTLLLIGAGYSARAAATLARADGWRVVGTARSAASVDALGQHGIEGLSFDGETPSIELRDAIAAADALVVSVAPDPQSDADDPVLAVLGDDLVRAPRLKHVAYLSTIGVYGDTGGAWVDETAEPQPGSERSKARLRAEQAWQAAVAAAGFRVHILRLAGIYGPGRSPVDRVLSGNARAIIKLGQVFNRIHQADIAAAIMAGLNGLGAEEVYNVTDDEPAPPQDVLFYAADRLGVARPPSLDFETADLTSMARSFYSETKRVRNTRLKTDLSVQLAFPTYREGIDGLVATASATR